MDILLIVQFDDHIDYLVKNENALSPHERTLLSIVCSPNRRPEDEVEIAFAITKNFNNAQECNAQMRALLGDQEFDVAQLEQWEDWDFQQTPDIGRALKPIYMTGFV